MADLDFKLVIEAITDSFEGAEKQVNGLFSTIEKNAKKIESIGKKLSVAVTAPIVAFAATSVKAFKDQEKAIEKFSDSFEKNGDRIGLSFQELTESAQNFSNTTLFDDDDILGSVTSQLLNFGNVTKDIFDRAQKAILDFSSKTGTDLESASVLIGKALQNPKEGLSQLIRTGVAFTDTERQIIEGLDEVGRSAEAQALILAKLEGTVGGFSEKAASLDSASFDRLAKAFNNLQESAGRAFQTVLTPFIDLLTDIIVKVSEFPPGVQAMIATFASLAAAIGPVLIVLPNLIAGFKLLQVALVGIGGPVGIIALIISGLVALTSAFGGVKNTALSFAIVINEAFLKVLEVIASTPDALSVIIPGLGLLKVAAESLVDTIKSNIDSLGKALDENIAKQAAKSGEQNNQKGKADAALYVDGYIDELNSGKLGGEVAKKIAEAQRKAEEEAQKRRDLNAKLEIDRIKELDRVAEQFARDQEQRNKFLRDSEQIIAGEFSQFFESMAFGAKSAGEAIEDLGRTIVQSLFSTALRQSLNAGFAGLFGGAAEGGFIQANAEGGPIKGPGTGTSDSILSRLSNGEFVIRAASVKKFGVDFFNALNSGFLPKFNLGGHFQKIHGNLSGVPRFATGGAVGTPGNVFVNVVNQSSVPVSAKATTRIDPRGSVVNVVLEDLRTNGAISQQIQGAFGVRR